jgi:hypothetical protein
MTTIIGVELDETVE